MGLIIAARAPATSSGLAPAGVASHHLGEVTKRDDETLTIRTLTRLSQDVSARAWDALVGDGSPFLEWGWLASL
ncbi:MAG: hypothetical protein ABGY42_02480, partial [bacterium]